MNRNSLLLGLVLTLLVSCGIAFFYLWNDAETADLDDRNRDAVIGSSDDSNERSTIQRSAGDATTRAIPHKKDPQKTEVNTPMGSGSITGRVIRARDKSVVSDIEVFVTTIVGNPVASTKTEKDGTFAVKGLPIEAEISLKVIGEKFASKAMPGIFLSSEQELEVGDLQVSPFTEIHGKVTRLGKNLPGAHVALLPNVPFDFRNLDLVALLRAMIRDDDPLGMTITDESGNFVFENIVPGEYAAAVTAEGCEFKHSKKITIRIGVATEKVKIDLQSGVSLKGTIKDENGQGIENALIAVMRDTRGGIPTVFKTLKTRSDAKGDFSFSQLGKSRYQFMVRAKGFAPASKRISVSSKNDAADFVLSKGITISGRITRRNDDEPIEGVTILGFGGRAPIAVETLSNADGYYELQDIKAKGQVNLIVKHERYKVIVPEDQKSPELPGLGMKFELKGDEGPVFNHDIQMTGGGTIKGRVINQDTGKGIARATVKVQSVEDMKGSPFGANNGKTVTTDAQGFFVIKGAPPGLFSLSARAKGFYSEKQDLSALGMLFGRARNTSSSGGNAPDPFAGLPNLEDGGLLVDQDIMLIPGLSQEGQTLGPSGKPIVGATIRWVEGDLENERSMLANMMSQTAKDPATSDENGRFTVKGLKKGIPIKFTAYHPEFPGGASKTIRFEDIGQEKLTLRLTVGAKLHGHVKGPDGPFVGLTIHAQPEETGSMVAVMLGQGKEFTAISDRSGNYSIDGLPTGKVRLSFEISDDFTVDGGEWQSTTIKKDEDKKLDFTVRRVSTVTGTVVDHNGKSLPRVQLQLLRAQANEKTGSQESWASSEDDGTFKLRRVSESATYELRATYYPRNLSESQIKRVAKLAAEDPHANDSHEGYSANSVWITMEGINGGSRNLRVVMDTRIFEKK